MSAYRNFVEEAEPGRKDEAARFDPSDLRDGIDRRGLSYIIVAGNRQISAYLERPQPACTNSACEGSFLQQASFAAELRHLSTGLWSVRRSPLLRGGHLPN
jgi:hypothetical protein